MEEQQQIDTCSNGVPTDVDDIPTVDRVEELGPDAMGMTEEEYVGELRKFEDSMFRRRRRAVFVAIGTAIFGIVFVGFMTYALSKLFSS